MTTEERKQLKTAAMEAASGHMEIEPDADNLERDCFILLFFGRWIQPYFYSRDAAAADRDVFIARLGQAIADFAGARIDEGGDKDRQIASELIPCTCEPCQRRNRRAFGREYKTERAEG